MNEEKQQAEHPAPRDQNAEEAKTPESSKPWWEGGPIDTIRGMPWNTAVEKCPEGKAVVLNPGKYSRLTDEDQPISVNISKPYTIVGPMSPEDALRGIICQMGPNPEPVTKPEAKYDNHPTYEELLAQYKDLCREIEGLGINYSGKPTKEEAKLKKRRLELRKTLRAMAPLKTCWFCSGFSINNYDSPCREGALVRGDVPKEACDCWAGAHHYIDGNCLVAWPEWQALQKAEKIKQEPSSSDQLAKDLNQAYIDDHPDVKAKAEASKKSAVQVMDENAQKAEARKSTGQTDLNGDVIKLPDGVKETKKVTKKREYTIEKFKLSINEKDLQNFPYVGLMSQRKLVVAKMRPLPDLDVDGDDWDDGIDEMIKVLSRAAIILKSDLLKEALIIQRLKEVA